ncbi:MULTISPECIES: hypothetical protein [unclassified Streptomyces]
MTGATSEAVNRSGAGAVALDDGVTAPADRLHQAVQAVARMHSLALAA